MVTISTVDSINEPNVDVGGSFQHKVWFANNLYWVIYADGALDNNMLYRTSSDGSTWSSSSVFCPNSEADWLDTWLIGTTLYYVRVVNSSSSRNLNYRIGTLNSNGTITWSGAEQTFQIESGRLPWGPTIYATSPSDIWVAVSTAIPGVSPPQYEEFWHYNGVSWSNVYEYLNPVIIALCGVVRSTADGVVAIFGDSDGRNDEPLHFSQSSDGGNTWSSIVNTVSNSNAGFASYVSYGHIVYIAFLTGAGGLNFVTYDSSTQTLSSEIVLHTATGDNWTPTLTIGSDGGLLLVYHPGGHISTNHTVYYRSSVNGGQSWSIETPVSTSEPYLIDNSLSASYSANSGANTGVTWIREPSGPGTAYDVRFGVLQMPVVQLIPPNANIEVDSIGQLISSDGLVTIWPWPPKQTVIQTNQGTKITYDRSNGTSSTTTDKQWGKAANPTAVLQGDSSGTIWLGSDTTEEEV